MSSDGFTEILPDSEAGFPDATECMSESVYSEFRIAAHNLLAATVALTMLDDAPPGWQRLMAAPSEDFRPQLLFSASHRILLSMCTTLHKKKSIDLSLVAYKGTEEPALVTEGGLQGIAHEGPQTSLLVKGVSARAPKPYLSGKSLPKKSSLQQFQLSSVGHTKGVAIGEGSEALWIAAHPFTRNYISAGNSPNGGEAIVKLTAGVANFLEGIGA